MNSMSIHVAWGEMLGHRWVKAAHSTLPAGVQPSWLLDSPQLTCSEVGRDTGPRTPGCGTTGAHRVPALCAGGSSSSGDTDGFWVTVDPPPLLLPSI